jgi:hypothetical protein
MSVVNINVWFTCHRPQIDASATRLPTQNKDTVILDGFIVDGCKDGRQALRSEARGRRATKAEGALHR